MSGMLKLGGTDERSEWVLRARQLLEGFFNASDQSNFDVLFNGDKLLVDIAKRIMTGSEIVEGVGELLSRSTGNVRRAHYMTVQSMLEPLKTNLARELDSWLLSVDKGELSHRDLAISADGYAARAKSVCTTRGRRLGKCLEGSISHGCPISKNGNAS
jgi:hypothetical protein